MVFFISDFHFGDFSICKYERFNFKTIEEHDSHIIKEYNKIVTDDSDVYILGDLGGWNGSKKEHLITCFNQLKGRKYLILGNHDNQSIEFYKSLNGVVEVYNHPIYLTKRIVLSHEPVLVNKDVLNVHGHLHGAELDLDNYLNVSCAIIGYKPIKVKRINDKVGTLKKESKKFLDEWYANYYIFRNNNSNVVTDIRGRINLKKSRILNNKI